jgi:hypothetical protein
MPPNTAVKLILLRDLNFVAKSQYARREPPPLACEEEGEEFWPFSFVNRNLLPNLNFIMHVYQQASLFRLSRI